MKKLALVGHIKSTDAYMWDREGRADLGSVEGERFTELSNWMDMGDMLESLTMK